MIELEHGIQVVVPDGIRLGIDPHEAEAGTGLVRLSIAISLKRIANAVEGMQGSIAVIADHIDGGRLDPYPIRRIP